MNDNDPVLAKVRKLLALAEDPSATTHEAETYTAKATALIASYGIDRALLAVSDPESDPVADLVIDFAAPYAADKADLLNTVARTLRCVSILRTRRRTVDDSLELSMHLFGHASDLERAEILFTSLLLQSASALARTAVPPFEHVAAFRRSWLAGFRMAVGGRLVTSERDAEVAAVPRFRDSGRTSALVLADRSVEVRSAAETAYPSLGTSRPRSLSGSGRAQGWSAGQRADLGASRLRTSRPQLG